jgi:hypothetical protein
MVFLPLVFLAAALPIAVAHLGTSQAAGVLEAERKCRILTGDGSNESPASKSTPITKFRHRSCLCLLVLGRDKSPPVQKPQPPIMVGGNESADARGSSRRTPT